MIRSFQTLIDPDKGDCWRSCIASILELPTESVPNFVGMAGKGFGEQASDLAKAWLRERGVVMLECRGDPKDAFNWFHLPGVFAIASVPSQKFAKCTHAVVAQWREHPENPDCTQLVIVHDPNPGNAPYPVDVKVHALTYLVPMRPKLGVRMDGNLPDGTSPFSSNRDETHKRAESLLKKSRK